MIHSKLQEPTFKETSMKDKHNEKVCRIQELGSHIQGQGHNQGSEVKSFLCEYLKLAETNFILLSKKVNHN